VKAVVTGAGGQLGQELCRLLPEAIGLDRSALAIDDLEAVRSRLTEIEPEVVFNCAAYNGVDAAEADAGPAFAVNAQGAANVAAVSREVGARLVHFSTNYVFDGEASEPYTEASEPRPQSAYARSKREGERLVLATDPSALVIRSSSLYGWGGSAVKGGSFPERLLARARAGQPLRVVSDQHHNPTFTQDLAAGSLGLVEEGMIGTVHLVAAGCCSWWEFTVELMRLAELGVEVAAISTAELGAAAARPRNGCLRSLRTEFLRPWPEGLAKFVAGARGDQPVIMPRP
jgi:dTDP-4-dehydrorhamnose reductase